MARVPTNRSNADWGANLAAISLAGVRIIRQASVQPGASAAATYTVQEVDCRRLVAFHSATNNTDIRVEQNGTAVATDLPFAPGVYFGFEVEKGDTVSFFNTTGTPIDVYLVELV